MPAINPSLSQTRSNVTFTPVSWDPLQLLSHISIVVAAFVLILALRCFARYRTHRHHAGREVNSVVQGRSLPQNLDEVIWEKSRGVSNTAWMDMSTNQRPAPTHHKAEVGMETLNFGEEPNWTMEPGTTVLEDGPEVNKPELAMKQHLRARPLLPPPLTCPVLATSMTTFEGRPLSASLSTTGDHDSTFFNQPNPDYTSSTSTSSSSAKTQPIDSPALPRRRSYTKTLPLGPPQPVSWLEEDGTITSFSPSSYPSSSPTLPLAPHETFPGHCIDMKGEIISVLDGSGAGWKRHTRVYGGGACLACMAADGEGGFYGARVREEEKR